MQGNGVSNSISVTPNTGTLSESVLVLNKYYTAIRVTNAKKAFTLLYKNSAEAIEEHNSQFHNLDFDGWIRLSQEKFETPLNNELFIRTPKLQLMIPKVIRLVTYDKIPKHEVKFNRTNILARDGNRCQYCGKRFPASKLSIDHVIPKSRGGKSIWTNVVAACSNCNIRKGGRLPSEVRIRLIKPPTVPKKNPTIADKIKSNRYQIWKNFLRESIAVES